MRTNVLAFCNLLCLLAMPGFLILGLLTFSESIVLGCLLIFMALPVCLGLSIVFDYVREQIDQDDSQLLKKTPVDPTKHPRKKQDNLKLWKP